MFSELIIIIGFLHSFASATGPDWRQGPDGNYDTLWELDPANLTSSLKTINVDEGDSVTFPCKVDTSGGGQELTWTKDGQTIWIMQFFTNGYFLQRIVNDTRISPENTDLTIQDIILEDAGKYSCEVYRTNSRISYNLIVTAPPKVKPSPSSLLIIKEGNNLTVTCSITGYPYPRISWLKNGNLLSAAFSEEAMTIGVAKLNHSGHYTCKAENEYGQKAEANITVEVQYPPKVTISGHTVFTGVGQTAYLYCNVNSLPPAKVSWSRNGVHINDSRLQRNIVEFGVKFLRHRLKIPKVREEDLGNYKCAAANVWGSESQRVILTAKPATPIVSLKCHANQIDECFISIETLSYSQILSYIVAFKNITHDSGWCTVTIPGRNSSSIYYTEAYDVSFLATEFGTSLKIKAINEFDESAFSKTLKLNPTGGLTELNFDQELRMGITMEAEYLNENFTIADENFTAPTAENCAEWKKSTLIWETIVIMHIILAFRKTT